MDSSPLRLTDRSGYQYIFVYGLSQRDDIEKVCPAFPSLPLRLLAESSPTFRRQRDHSTRWRWRLRARCLGRWRTLHPYRTSSCSSSCFPLDTKTLLPHLLEQLHRLPRRTHGGEGASDAPASGRRHWRARRETQRKYDSLFGSSLFLPLTWRELQLTVSNAQFAFDEQFAFPSGRSASESTYSSSRVFLDVYQDPPAVPSTALPPTEASTATSVDPPILSSSSSVDPSSSSPSVAASSTKRDKAAMAPAAMAPVGELTSTRTQAFDAEEPPTSAGEGVASLPSPRPTPSPPPEEGYPVDDAPLPPAPLKPATTFSPAPRKAAPALSPYSATADAGRTDAIVGVEGRNHSHTSDNPPLSDTTLSAAAQAESPHPRREGDEPDPKRRRLYAAEGSTPKFEDPSRHHVPDSNSSKRIDTSLQHTPSPRDLSCSRPSLIPSSKVPHPLSDAPQRDLSRTQQHEQTSPPLPLEVRYGKVSLFKDFEAIDKSVRSPSVFDIIDLPVWAAALPRNDEDETLVARLSWLFRERMEDMCVARFPLFPFFRDLDVSSCSHPAATLSSSDPPAQSVPALPPNPSIFRLPFPPRP